MKVLAPESEEELAALVSEARTAGRPMEIAGGGTRLALGRPVQAEATLSTSGLSGIGIYEPGALTLVVRAGTPLEEVEAALAAEGQRLPFEPMDHRPLLGTEGTPTIGGAVMTAAAGPRRIQAGAVRDLMLGVRMVTGGGEIVKNGGRVMKNVTGYDLVKLMAGSFGTLGVLTEVAFKVLPASEDETTLVAEGLSPGQAIEAMAEALGTPYEISGAAHLDAAAAGGNAQTCLRVEGFASQTAYRVERLLRILGPAWSALGAEESRTLWRRIRDVGHFAGRPGAVWKLVLTPGAAPAAVAQIAEAGFDPAAIYDWGGGRVWLLVPEDADPAAIHSAAARAGGGATLVRASPATRSAVAVFPPLPGPVAAISARLRETFDPGRVLNPGRMGA